MKTLAPPSETEDHFQERVVRLARRRGWQTMHVRRGRGRNGWNTPTTVPGWPDLVLWRPGHFLLAELKADRGRLAPAQASVVASLRRAGVRVEVWRPSDWQIIRSTLSKVSDG